MLCVIPTVRSMRVKFFFGILLLLSVYIFLFYLMIQMWLDRKSLPVSMSSVVLPHVVVHIDLKGAPPKLKYLESLLPMLKDHGVTGLLIEYEDMFPYEGALKNISSRNCYGRDELRKFLETAAKANFNIIPLIQTFGHMEHVLKLQEFMNLREQPAFPDSLCPTKQESHFLVQDMLQQVMSFHNSIAPLDYIHVGCDEVFHINTCEQCVARQLKDISLYVDYVTLLVDIVKNISQQTTVLIWDDMLRSITPPGLDRVSLPMNMQPVYWDYRKELKLSHISLLQYQKAFSGIWIASAFKGADGKGTTMPDILARYHNHFNWMKTIRDYRFGGQRQTYNFQGIILTGWSRYSHFDAPCELLPVAIPSLILNLLLIRKFKTGVTLKEIDYGADSFRHYLNDDLSYSLKCHSRGFENLGTEHFKNCDFDSSQLYEVLENYELFKSRIVEMLMGPLSSVNYYASKRFLDPNSVKQQMHLCNFTLNELIHTRTLMYHYMSPYYKNEVIYEYVNFKTYGYMKSLRLILKKLKFYSRKRVWERNPLNVTF